MCVFVLAYIAFENTKRICRQASSRRLRPVVKARSVAGPRRGRRFEPRTRTTAGAEPYRLRQVGSARGRTSVVREGKEFDARSRDLGDATRLAEEPREQMRALARTFAIDPPRGTTTIVR